MGAATFFRGLLLEEGGKMKLKRELRFLKVIILFILLILLVIELKDAISVVIPK